MTGSIEVRGTFGGTENVRLVVRNKDRLFNKLRRLDGQIQQELAAATLKGAEEVAAMAANLAPKNPATPSDYAGSINAKPVDKITTGEIGAVGVSSSSLRDRYVAKRGKNRGKMITRRGRAGANTTAAAGVFAKFVWRFIEYGTVNNPAVPHMGVAYRALRKRIQGRMSRAIGKAVKRIAAT